MYRFYMETSTIIILIITSLLAIGIIVGASYLLYKNQDITTIFDKSTTTPVNTKLKAAIPVPDGILKNTITWSNPERTKSLTISADFFKSQEDISKKLPYSLDSIYIEGESVDKQAKLVVTSVDNSEFPPIIMFNIKSTLLSTPPKYKFDFKSFDEIEIVSLKNDAAIWIVTASSIPEVAAQIEKKHSKSASPTASSPTTSSPTSSSPTTSSPTASSPTTSSPTTSSPTTSSPTTSSPTSSSPNISTLTNTVAPNTNPYSLLSLVPPEVIQSLVPPQPGVAINNLPIQNISTQPIKNVATNISQQINPSPPPTATTASISQPHSQIVNNIATSAGITPSTVEVYTPPITTSTNTPTADTSSINVAQTPIPPTTASHSNPKKGFVVGNSDPTAAAKLHLLNLGWYYTWGAKPPTTPPPGINFTPMFWNVSKTTPPCSLTNCPLLTDLSNGIKLNTAANLPIGQDNVLLGYNEPDGTNTNAQGNMTVSEAVQFWQLISDTNRQRLGSPVMFGSLIHTSQCKNNVPPPAGYNASAGVFTTTINISNNTTPNIVSITPGQWDTAGNNVSGIWLDNFLYQLYQYNSKSATKARYPDIICVHWYGPPNATSFINYLKMIYAKYNLPIWVTEYSCADWTATCCSPKSPYSRLTYSNITTGTTHTAGFDWSYPLSSLNANTNTNATAQFMIQTTTQMNSLPFVERYSWKERFYLLPPNTPIPTGGVATNYSVESPTNPDVMGQSTLFASFEHFPSNGVPPLTPLGQLYASL